MADMSKTKKSIVDALKKLCVKKPFEKISISDITNMCNLNRQSFYYHFADKYELLSFIYYNECFLKTVDGITFDNWDQRLLQMMIAMRDSKSFYVSTIKQDEKIFHDYLYDITNTLFCETVDVLDTQKQLSEEDKMFFADFLSYGICGVIVSWVKKGMKTPPENIAKHMKNLELQCQRMAFMRYMNK